jgi:hypothetical protein
VPLAVGRSVREPRKDGREYQAIRLIALRSACEPLNSDDIQENAIRGFTTGAARSQAVGQELLYGLTVADRAKTSEVLS